MGFKRAIGFLCVCYLIVYLQLNNKLTLMAKLFTTPTDNRYQINNDNIRVFGAYNSQTIMLDATVQNIELDSNIEKIEFANPIADYRYKQTGNTLEIYDTLNAVIASIGVQDDSDGTQLTFLIPR